MMIAQAALGARDFATARAAMAPLIGGGARPTARMCVIMAEIEDREHDAQGLVREWLARGSRAPRDAAWVADGHYSRQWAPVSPVTGKLDAYRWLQPKEELSGPIEEPPPAYQPPPALTVDEAPGDEGASLEILPPVAAGPELAPETPTRKTASPQPVVFPLATPPDDPGPKKQQVETRLF
jgi:HemY protein